MDDGSRRFHMTGGGPLDGITARIYPDRVDDHRTNRKVWRFQDVVFDDGVYLLGAPADDRKKVAAGHWKEKR